MHSSCRHRLRTYLPIWILMVQQCAFMCTRKDYQAAIGSVDFLHCRPRTNDLICRSEREVVKILVHWMARRLCARIWRLEFNKTKNQGKEKYQI